MLKDFLQVLKRGASDFIEDECMSSGAAIAYYTIFSLPPLMVLVFFLAESAGVSHEQIDQIVRKQVGMPLATDQMQDLGGPVAEDRADDTVAARNNGSAEQAERKRTTQEAFARNAPGIASGLGPVSRAIGLLILVFSATGVFAELQHALNRAWEVEPDPEQGGVKNFLVKRALSLGMIVVIALLLLVSMVLTTVVEEIIGWVQGEPGGPVATALAMLLNNVAAFAMALVLFAATFRLLPDAKMAWRDVWAGAAITALLFVVGKAALGYYLRSSDVGSSWGGAAASIIGTLVWVYYSSLIVLLGAEITQAWANEFGKGIEPAKGAVRIREEKRHIREGEQSPA